MTMKRMMTMALLAMLATLAGCNGEKPSDKLLDPNAMVTINVEDGKSTRVENPDLPYNPLHLTPHELVAQAENMLSVRPNVSGDYEFWLGAIIEEGDYLTTKGRKAGEYQYKLLDEAKFVFWGDLIIEPEEYKGDKKVHDTRLSKEFFLAKDIRFVDKEGTIIGYIPQRVILEAWAKIVPAFESGDYETVYQLFRETYQAFPCTEEEWHDLKARGLS